jgi:predicted DNA-binding protein
MDKIQDNYKRTTISLRGEEYEILRFIAFRQKTSVAGVVRGLIKELIEDQEDIRDGLKALQDQTAGLDWQTFKNEKLAL